MSALQVVSTHRLTESDFRVVVTLSTYEQPCRHFTQKSAATWWVHTKLLPGSYTAAFLQFLFCSIHWLATYWITCIKMVWPGHIIITTPLQEGLIQPSLKHLRRPYTSTVLCSLLDSRLTSLTVLTGRREQLGRKFFDSMIEPRSRLHQLLPPFRDSVESKLPT